MYTHLIIKDENTYLVKRKSVSNYWYPLRRNKSYTHSELQHDSFANKSSKRFQERITCMEDLAKCYYYDATTRELHPAFNQ